MTDADYTPGREPRSVAASFYTFFLSVCFSFNACSFLWVLLPELNDLLTDKLSVLASDSWPQGCDITSLTSYPVAGGSAEDSIQRIIFTCWSQWFEFPSLLQSLTETASDNRNLLQILGM